MTSAAVLPRGTITIDFGAVVLRDVSTQRIRRASRAFWLLFEAHPVVTIRGVFDTSDGALNLLNPPPSRVVAVDAEGLVVDLGRPLGLRFLHPNKGKNVEVRMSLPPSGEAEGRS